MQQTMQHIFVLIVLLLCCSSSSSSSSSSRTKVHVIFMNHLDVGYSTPSKPGFAINVLNLYFSQYYLQAVKLANAMRDAGFNQQQFRYTTHPWILDLYLNCPSITLNNVRLNCPNATSLQAVTDAIVRGDIVWHAGPMNMQLENMNATLLEAALNISRRLDDKFQLRKPLRVLSQRDVPGISSAVIPTLRRNNVTAVTVGVNPACYPPAVTREPFLWQDEFTGESVIGIWHPGGYPNNPGSSPQNPGGISSRDCSMISGIPHILCFSFRGDNSGPPQSVQEVLTTYDILESEFPGAEIIASTLEDFITAITPYQSLMQIVKTEIGDTWIQGIASDPRKMAEYRALSRAFTNCYSDGHCPSTDAVVQNAVRFIVKLPEHTWGLPSQPDQVNYANSKFKMMRNQSRFLQNEAAWIEQRQFISFATAAAKGHILQQYMQHELQQLQVANKINLTGYRSVNLDSNILYKNNGYSISFDKDGSLRRFSRNGGSEFANDAEKLSKFVYRSYDETDDHQLLASYGNPGYGKPNITANAHPVSKRWKARAVKFYERSDNSSFFVQLQMEQLQSVSDYGAPQSVFLNYTFVQDHLLVELLLWNKTPTRIEEALFLEFQPQMRPGCKWWLQKVEKLVDPQRVTSGGTVLQHAVNDAAVLQCTGNDAVQGTEILTVRSIDVPTACPFSKFREASPFPFVDRLTSVDGVSFNIYNNVWITNYIFWYPFINDDANFKARFILQIDK